MLSNLTSAAQKKFKNGKQISSYVETFPPVLATQPQFQCLSLSAAHGAYRCIIVHAYGLSTCHHVIFKLTDYPS